MNVSVDPDALAQYARSASRAEQLIRRAERQFVADLGRRGGLVGAPVWSLLDEVRRLADGEATTGRWVQAVAHAVRAADRAPSEIRAIVVDTCMTVARDGQISTAVADAFEVLLATDPTAVEVTAAAMALGPDGLERLIVSRPDLVGPVDGMPPRARYRANRVMVALLASATTDAARRAALLTLLVPDERTGRPRQILLIDGMGDGRVAEVFGDLDTADAVAVVVPGMGTDLDNFEATVRTPVASLADVAGPSTATVAWLGYDPPDGFGIGPDERADLLHARAAHLGGDALGKTVDGLDLDPAVTVTLIGHSYGSTTVAADVAAGGRVDRVVALGSPGMLVDRTADFGRTDVEFFTMAADYDLIAHLGWFGRSPNRMGSGYTPLPVNGRGHSAYLRPGSANETVLADLIRRPR